MTVGSETAELFAALAPWRTRFVIGGEVFGGEVDYSDDQRVPTFFRWFGSPRTILELGSEEGGHTVQLAAPETTERVLGLESYPDNVARARLVADLLGRGNVEFAIDDLETVTPDRYGRFDAVFCAGLLHRVPTPWKLLSEVGRVGDRLFLDTHYWGEPSTVDLDGHRGGWLEDSEVPARSGADRRSFCLTRPALIESLTNAGWAVRYVADQSRRRSRPRVWLGCVRPTSITAG